MKRRILITILILVSTHWASSQEVSRALAELAILTGSPEISENAIHATHKALIDVFGVAIAAYNSPGLNEIITQEKTWGGNPISTIWVDGTKISPPDAAFINSTLVHALDFDDIHIPGILHITSSVVPSAIAVGEAQGASGKEVLEAIIMGIEVAGRLGREYQARRENSGFLPSSIVGGFGATAACSRLLGLSVEQTMNAFGIFYAHASGNRTALIEQTLSKRIQPAIACRASVISAYYAKDGITGAHNIFSSDFGLFALYAANKKPYPTAEEIKKKKDYFEVEQLAYKKFASCGGSHALLEATLDLTNKYDLKLDEIEKIEIFIGAATMVAEPWDPNVENLHVSAEFCAPYQVVTTIKNKKQGPEEITEYRIKQDIEVSNMAQKVIIREPAEYGDGSYKKQSIIITLKNGKIIEKAQEVHEKLFTQDYMTYQDIIEKFKTNINYSELLTKDKINSMLKAIEGLENETNISAFIDKYLRIENQN